MTASPAKPARAPSEEATSDYWSLVNRLRRAAAPRHDPLQETDLYTEAAAEIERLSTALLNPSEETVEAAARAHCFNGGCGVLNTQCQRAGECLVAPDEADRIPMRAALRAAAMKITGRTD